jgi:hypothetical protein
MNTSYPEARLLEIYREQMAPLQRPDAVTLIRWADRIETAAQFNVARRSWSYEQAGSLVDEVNEPMRLWRSELPTWVVELPQDDGIVVSRHIEAPTYEQAIQLWD